MPTPRSIEVVGIGTSVKALSLSVKDLLGFLALAFLEDDDGEEAEGHASDDRYERPEDYGAGEAEKFGREDHLICRLGV